MKYNSIKPISGKKELKKYKPIRKPDETRDEHCSPVHDAIMDAICERIKEYGGNDIFNTLWTSSIFPERLTNQLLRIIEDYDEMSKQIWYKDQMSQ